MASEAVAAAERVIMRNIYGVLGEVIVLGALYLIGEVSKKAYRKVYETKAIGSCDDDMY